MEMCPNTLCAYNIKRQSDFKCAVFDNLVAHCVCYQAFKAFSKTIDIDREFNSGAGSYHQWQEIKRLASVQRMKTADASVYCRMKVTEHKWEEGDYGHDFIQGYFVVNEKLEQIYLDKNHDEYVRLMAKYSTLQEQKRKARL
jgi:hypothetical protein